MPAADGKMRLTDVADTEQLLRLIQSIPSPKAEPFKLWLADVGKDRLDEIADPEKSIERAINTYRNRLFRGMDQPTNPNNRNAKGTDR